MSESRRPRLSTGIRLQRDRPTQRWMLVGPERGLWLSETAHAALTLCDGTRTEDEIVSALTARFEASKVRVQGDIARLFQDLRARCLLENA